MIRYAPAVSSIPSAIFVAVAGSLPRRRSHVHSPTSSGVNSRMNVGFTDWKISGEMLVLVASRAQNVSVKPFWSKAIQKITTTPKIKSSALIRSFSCFFVSFTPGALLAARDRRR